MAKKALEDLELDVDEVLLMELIDYASKRGTVRAVQDLVAKALAEAPAFGGSRQDGGDQMERVSLCAIYLFIYIYVCVIMIKHEYALYIYPYMYVHMRLLIYIYIHTYI